MTVVTEPWSQDDDLVLWTLLLAEDLNAAALARLQEEHPDVRYSHGFLFQQLVSGPQPVGALAEQLGVTSQAISKTASELERLGYGERVKDRNAKLLLVNGRLLSHSSPAIPHTHFGYRNDLRPCRR